MVVEENRLENVIIGGNFNIKIGGETGCDVEEDIWDRVSKVINQKGEELIEMVEEIGSNIMNGATKGDKKGEYVRPRGSLVIYYIIVGLEYVKDFKVEERIEFDHLPIVLETRRHKGNNKEREEEEKEERVENIRT